MEIQVHGKSLALVRGETKGKLREEEGGKKDTNMRSGGKRPLLVE